MHAVDSPATAPPEPVAPSTPDTQGARVRRRRPEWTPLFLALPALVLLAALLAYPLGRMVVLSFQDLQLRHLFSGATPPWVGFDNYTQILTDGVFWSVVLRTAVFTVVSVSISIVLGLGIALLMGRVSNGVRVAMMITMMFVWAIPQLVSAQIFKWMVDADFGVLNYLIDQIPGVDFANHSWFADPTQGWIVITTLVVWAGIPFLAITLHAGLTQVPQELREAALVDGANAWQSLRNIVLPILRPLLVIVTTLSVIWNFGLFTQVWALRDSKPEQEYQTLATYAFTQAFGRSEYSLGSAISVVTVLLMLGVMAFYVRQMFQIGDVD
ncbi:carbohydrate ABC transporter permease [Phytohabitans suffuscus]|uniref:Sugar ABC transporter permease n=1 Tax=Phytohabitans suffuscus TaxID=624315 RepID=A0A6F8YPJ9_9ACTN|nr:sugar ABC transporter permease [Phytohabitans suffuscus]BCB88052.1 sugar ABC transporter permease [Phytohabitans suffuscus]